MGRKPKYTAEQKIQASLDHLGGKKSPSKIAGSLGMEKRQCQNKEIDQGVQPKRPVHIRQCIWESQLCEGLQELFKDMLFILHPDIKCKKERMETIEDTKDYYINHYPR